MHTLHYRSLFSAICVASFVTLVLVGCGDDTGGGDGDGDGDGDGGPALSHAVDIQPIWTANCMGAEGTCHVAGGLWVSPNFGEESAYDAIVGKMALQPFVNGEQMNYVEPDDVANSYLVHKIEGTHLDVKGSGEKMPCDMVISADLSCAGNVMTLAASDLQTIKDWIEDGAPE